MRRNRVSRSAPTLWPLPPHRPDEARSVSAPCGSAAGADSRSPNNRRVWQQDESGRVHTPFEPVVLAATLRADPGPHHRGGREVRWLADVRGGRELGHLGHLRARARAVLVVAKRKRAALRAHWLDVGDRHRSRSRSTARRSPGFGSPASSASLASAVIIVAPCGTSRAPPHHRRHAPSRRDPDRDRSASRAPRKHAFASGEFAASGTGSGGPSRRSPPSATATSTRPLSRDASSGWR